MSYSFVVRGQTKAIVMILVSDKVDDVIAKQPMHARDREAIIANVSSILDHLTHDHTKDISVSCNGFLSYLGSTVDNAQLTSLAISCSAGMVARQ